MPTSVHQSCDLTFGRHNVTKRVCGEFGLFARRHALAGLRAIYEALTLVLGELRQRVQLNALVERCSGYLAEVAAEGFPARSVTRFDGMRLMRLTLRSTRRSNIRSRVPASSLLVSVGTAHRRRSKTRSSRP